MARTLHSHDTENIIILQSVATAKLNLYLNCFRASGWPGRLHPVCRQFLAFEGEIRRATESEETRCRTGAPGERIRRERQARLARVPRDAAGQHAARPVAARARARTVVAQTPRCRARQCRIHGFAEGA